MSFNPRIKAPRSMLTCLVAQVRTPRDARGLPHAWLLRRSSRGSRPSVVVRFGTLVLCAV
jgi:hypothetical protein